jgi:hypothetical protein
MAQTLAASEISEIDDKIQKLNRLRTDFLGKVMKLEEQETDLEHERNIASFVVNSDRQ